MEKVAIQCPLGGRGQAAERFEKSSHLPRVLIERDIGVSLVSDGAEQLRAAEDKMAARARSSRHRKSLRPNLLAGHCQNACAALEARFGRSRDRIRTAA
jgi:hypothetical protein